MASGGIRVNVVLRIRFKLKENGRYDDDDDDDNQ